MKIEDRNITATDYLTPVTYVPNHVNGDAGHEACEQGVLISTHENTNIVKVLYCKSRTVQNTNPDDLVWG